MLLSVRSIKKKKVEEFSELCASFRHLVVLEIREVSSKQKKRLFSLTVTIAWTQNCFLVMDWCRDSCHV